MTCNTRTRNDLVNQALANLGILSAGQNASAEDFDAVNNMVEPMVSWLEEAEIVFVDDLEAIENSIFNPLAVLLAGESALMFGLAGVPTAPNQPDALTAAIDKIRLVEYGRPTQERLKTEYF